MSKNNNHASSSGIGIGGILFVVFLIMKLKEKCAFWGDSFPRFLKSTEAWWDGWFMVFLPLWGGLVIAVAILLIVCIFALIVNR